MDYSIFDSLLDSVFVIDADRRIEYCNEPAAALCESSVRRLTRGKSLFDIFNINDSSLFLTPEGTVGKYEPLPFKEVTFNLVKGEKEGRVQVAIQPFEHPEGPRWVVLFRDVTLEEVLHGKYRRELEGKEKLIVELQQAQAQLEEYSKGLEKMVEERTSELNDANRTLSAIMNSLGQGFLVFDSSGMCGDVYTKICEDILETIPANQTVCDVLKLKDTEKESFRTWVGALFSEALPFDSMKDLGPEHYQHSQDKVVCLNYHAIRDQEEKISNIVMVATDKTEEFLANQALEREKARAKMIVKLVTSKASFNSFFHDIPNVVNELIQEINKSKEQLDADHAYRVLHSLEGMAATFSVMAIVKELKAAQEILSPLRSGEVENRASVVLDFLSSLNSIGESYKKFCEENRELLELISGGEDNSKEIPLESIERALDRIKMKEGMHELFKEVEADLLKQPLLDGITSQAITLKSTIDSLGKELAPLGLEGSDIRVFHEPYRDFFKSLVHLYRNIADHGIEAPDEREMVGKSRKGHVAISIKRQSEVQNKGFQIIISDDGGGIDVEKIRNKLVEMQPDKNWSQVSDSAILQTIFRPGLTTKESVSEFSGRGVGMDAVKHELNKIGGAIVVESQPGVGTRFEIILPDLENTSEISKAA